MIHAPVMLEEVCSALDLKAGARVVDCTFGAGGYSRALLERENIKLLALDRDPTVRPHAEALAAEFGDRFAFTQTPFSGLEAAIAGQRWDGVEGVVLDIGVSSMQIDNADRGFSFMRNGPLDMRMGDTGPTAADAVNHLSAQALSAIFRTFGEERGARRAAAAIVNARAEQPILTTGALAELMAQVLGGGWQKIHPATRVFQALRIYINDELGELHRALLAAERMLVPAGRLVVVAFHSLEDRIVKQFFRVRSELPSQGSRHVPVGEAIEFSPTFSMLGRKAQKPGAEEVSANPRARSARLRAGIRQNTAPMAAPPLTFRDIPDLDTLEALI
ncbi:MAG: 16S rRNA (cytosine(1402)-N(4))-methyltransferase RsmH [Robiginitomaculum sp.]|nr:16S rRNA (cytosine(1402)-N(4))-methyltransferase RsmH [Robiginitomaculum sp.]MDQ7077810.1 16S rRNA (cytosine(1402)-N(4))-methyltransferase RsmH [Robiginitomaculum sp.]